MNFQLLEAQDEKGYQRWKEVWTKWPQREVFASPDYLLLFSSPQNLPYCALLESAEGQVLYPFFYRTLCNESYYISADEIGDIITPYGYGGAFVWNCSDAVKLAEVFWKSFDSWAVEKKVVSEVVKFHLFKEQLIPYPGREEHKLDNVVVDLEKSEEELWREFEHKVRKNVKKAQANDLRIVIDQEAAQIDKFYDIYIKTMSRRNADALYHFSKSFFEKLCHSLKGNYLFFHAFLGETAISTELALLSADKIYSYLGGTIEDFFMLRPNDLIKWEMIRWAKANGLSKFVLGGGYEADDGIFKYKRSFSPSGIVPFYVGTRILDPRRYAELVNAKAEQLTKEGISWEARANFIPAYRT